VVHARAHGTACGGSGCTYIWAGLADSPGHPLAAIHRRLPAGAAFSGRSAGWLHGLDLSPCDPVEVTIPAAAGVAALSGVSVRRSELRPEDVVELRGLPATSALRTAIDLGRWLPLTDAVVAVDMALQKGLITLTELDARVAGQPRCRGIGQLRRVVQLAEPAAESPMETRLRLILVLSGLPRPRAQVSLYDAGGRFLGRPDLLYPVERLAVEYDGAAHRERLLEDNRRQNRLTNAGYRLLRFTAADVLGTPDRIVSLAREALSPPGPARDRSSRARPPS
jgi:hypothetical protein